MSVTSETLGIINFTMSLNGVSNYQSVLNALESNMKTDMSFDEMKKSLYPIRIIIVGCDDDSREVVQVFTNVYNAEN
ncbi:hypothetical protein EfmAA94_19720 [Enterococcus faecium]|nr:hypothetical protein EfmAA94_19720 [Enterococcus faecium]